MLIEDNSSPVTSDISDIIDESIEVEEGFATLGLPDLVLKGVQQAGYVMPTPIQTAAIPLALAGKDLIGIAQTGSGKTAAYALGAFGRLKKDKTVEILTLVPTRELATQVAAEFEKLGKPLGIRSVSIVGGQSIMRQVELVNQGCHVVVATPGRLLDQLKSGRLKRFAPHIVIYDEADEMLDMGFIDDIKLIGEMLPKERQSLLFSATLSRGIRSLIDTMLVAPTYLKVENDDTLQPKIAERLYVAPEAERIPSLVRLLQFEEPAKGMVFCRTRLDSEAVHRALSTSGLKTNVIHGDMSQPTRDAAIRSLRDGSVRLLVATDVASRGLDVQGLTHVFNFHLPDNEERYVHRIGRTGRAGNTGIAITIATPGEVKSHRLFRQRSLERFQLGRVPGKRTVEDLWNKKVLDDICATEPTALAEQTCQELYETEFGYDLMVRMLTMIQSSYPVHGPEDLGLTQDAISRLVRGSSFETRGPRGKYKQASGSGRKPQRDQRQRRRNR